MTALWQALPVPGPASPHPAAVLQPGTHMAAPAGRRPTALPLCLWQRYVPMEKHGFHPVPGPFTICKDSALCFSPSSQCCFSLLSLRLLEQAASRTRKYLWVYIPWALSLVKHWLVWGYKHFSSLAPNWTCSETDTVLRAYCWNGYRCCTFTWPTLPSWSHALTPWPVFPGTPPNKASSCAPLSHYLLLGHLHLGQELSPATSCGTLDKALVLFGPVSLSVNWRETCQPCRAIGSIRGMSTRHLAESIAVDVSCCQLFSQGLRFTHPCHGQPSLGLEQAGTGRSGMDKPSPMVCCPRVETMALSI